MQKIKVKYVGKHNIVFNCPGFVGRIKPDNGLNKKTDIRDTIEIDKDIYEKELKTTGLWELVKEKKAEAKKEEPTE